MFHRGGSSMLHNKPSTFIRTVHFDFAMKNIEKEAFIFYMCFHR